MEVYKGKVFARFARKARISDRELWQAVQWANEGLIDADLGGGVIKLRIARPGEGKSGGSRSIVVFRKGDRAVFVFGFAKKDRPNIRPDELERFQKLAGLILNYTAGELRKRIEDGELFPVLDAKGKRMAKTYRSKIMAAIHETAEGLYKGGGMDEKTMREFDAACLTPTPKMPPEKIRALREREQASQVVFAAYLGVTSSLVSKWERGEKHPRGASLKLLSLVEKKGLDAVA